jgi:hypothetical protein
MTLKMNEMGVEITMHWKRKRHTDPSSFDSKPMKFLYES